MFHRVAQGSHHGRPNLQRRLDFALRGASRETWFAFTRWLGLAFGFVEPPASLGAADKMVPWLFREWRKPPQIDAEQVLAIRDWWTAERVDLGGLTFVEADAAQMVWHKALMTKRRRAEVAVQLRGRVVLSFPDGSAWHMVPKGTTDPKTLKMLQAVGVSLGHCYAKLPVLQEYLADGVAGTDLYTLYDHQREPHVTIAAYPEERRAIVDCKITGNVDIPVNSRWAPHAVALIEHRVLGWSKPLLHLAPPAVLQRLARTEDVRMRCRVAEHTGTPPAVLSSLARDTDDDVRKAVGDNDSTPPSVLGRLVEDQDPYVRRRVARNSNTPPSALSRMSRDSDDYVRRNVGRNPCTPLSVLVRMSRDQDSFIREGVALNPSTPPAVLVRLAQDSSPEVRRVVEAKL